MARALVALLLAFAAVQGALAATTEAPSTDAGSTESPSTGAGSTESPSTGAGSTESPSTGAGSTGAPATGGGSTETPSTGAASTQAPSTVAGSTESPSTGAGSTEAPSSQAGSTASPSTGSTATGAGSTESPSTASGPTEAPSGSTEAPTTGSTETGAGSTESPSTGSGSTEAPSGSTEAPTKAPTKAPTTKEPTTTTTVTIIANPGKVATSLLTAVGPGDSVLDVASTTNFLVGDKILISKGLPDEEAHVIKAISSIILKDPIQKVHPVNSTVTVEASCQSFANYYSCPAGTSIHAFASLLECADKTVCAQSDEDRCCVSPTAMCQNGIVSIGKSTEYCCEAGCGKCGGLDCDKRVGGAQKCCTKLSPKCNTTTDDTCVLDKPTTTAAPVTAAPVVPASPCTTAAPAIMITTVTTTPPPPPPAPVQIPASPCGTAPPMQTAVRLFEGRNAEQRSSAFTLVNAGLLVMGFASIAALSVGVRAIQQRRSSTRAFALVELEAGGTVEAGSDEQETPLMG